MIAAALFKAPMRMVLFGAFLLNVVLASAPGQSLAPPSDRDIWEIGRRELGFLNNFQPEPHGFLMDAYAQYLGAEGEVLNDSWKLARVSWGPNGLTMTDLEPPDALLPFSSGARKTGLFTFTYRRSLHRFCNPHFDLRKSRL